MKQRALGGDATTHHHEATEHGYPTSAVSPPHREATKTQLAHKCGEGAAPPNHKPPTQDNTNETMHH